MYTNYLIPNTGPPAKTIVPKTRESRTNLHFPRAIFLHATFKQAIAINFSFMRVVKVDGSKCP